MGESDSRPQFGKLLLYHLTNPAMWNTLSENANKSKQKLTLWASFWKLYFTGGTGAAGAGFFGAGIGCAMVVIKNLNE